MFKMPEDFSSFYPLFFDALDMAIDRVMNEGVNSEGVPFSPYSQKQIPAFRFYETLSTFGSAQAQLKGKKTLSYADARQMVGRRTDIKNFQFTGTMWQQLQMIDPKIENGILFADYGFPNLEDYKKYIMNSDREGVDLIGISDEEMNILLDNFLKWFFEQL